mgnify:FL=1
MTNYPVVVILRLLQASGSIEQGIEYAEELVDFDRFGEMSVHARFERALTVFIEGIGGNGKDRH